MRDQLIQQKRINELLIEKILIENNIINILLNPLNDIKVDFKNAEIQQQQEFCEMKRNFNLN